MITITFEAADYDKLVAMITKFSVAAETAAGTEKASPKELLERAADAVNPAPKPKVDPHRNAEQKAAAAEKMAKVRAAKGKGKKANGAEPKPKSVVPEPPPVKNLVQVIDNELPARLLETQQGSEQMSFEDLDLTAQEPEPEEITDPVQLAAIRVKTTQALQEAYAEGKHKQVLALLAEYGNGAKSFRELALQDFVPIRRAIENGALA